MHKPRSEGWGVYLGLQKRGFVLIVRIHAMHQVRMEIAGHETQAGGRKSEIIRHSAAAEAGIDQQKRFRDRFAQNGLLFIGINKRL